MGALAGAGSGLGSSALCWTGSLCSSSTFPPGFPAKRTCSNDFLLATRSFCGLLSISHNFAAIFCGFPECAVVRFAVEIVAGLYVISFVWFWSLCTLSARRGLSSLRRTEQDSNLIPFERSSEDHLQRREADHPADDVQTVITMRKF
jgi:hypothetical protein